jgi:aryl-alcohol dehydrogenase-like predicted oxidoreductase
MGHSEELVGRAVAGRRDRVVVATKAGHIDHHSVDYAPSALERSLDASLHRLGMDYVDLLQLHGPTIEMLRETTGLIAWLERMQTAGKIRSFGLSANTPPLAVAAIQEFGFAVVQANFNMLDIRAIDCGLFDLAREAGVGIIARTPLAFGFLAGGIATGTIFPPEDHRSRFNGHQVERWIESSKAMHESTEAPDTVEGRVQTALRFCLSVPEVSVVIPGILTAAEVDVNAAASDIGPLSEQVFAKIIELSRENDPFAKKNK